MGSPDRYICIISLITLHIVKGSNPSRVDKVFRRLQLVSSAAYSLGHGGNDAQKVMGIISATLIFYAAYLKSHGLEVPHWAVVEQALNDKGKMVIKHIPSWVTLGCYTAMGLGTLMGGWRIVKTMGSKITKLTPFEGVAAETAGAITLYLTQALGIPVSTTHTITGSIVGVGLTKRLSAVRWGVTISLFWAWILTIPVSAVLAGLIYSIVRAFLT